jgi:hypothetical protein
MRKASAVILLAAFLATQYSKQLSYLECNLGNIFRSAIKKCDCEKLIDEIKIPASSSSLPVHHSHVHLDDMYDMTEICDHVIADFSMQIQPGSSLFRISKGKLWQVDRPPRV